MDCHRCEYVRYDGCSYGHCVHRGHKDVILCAGPKGGKRRYNMDICPDFKLKKRCSNCKYWTRGKYFADGRTPARKGRCSLRCVEAGGDCPLWKKRSASGRKKGIEA